MSPTRPAKSRPSDSRSVQGRRPALPRSGCCPAPLGTARGTQRTSETRRDERTSRCNVIGCHAVCPVMFRTAVALGRSLPFNIAALANQSFGRAVEGGIWATFEPRRAARTAEEATGHEGGCRGWAEDRAAQIGRKGTGRPCECRDKLRVATNRSNRDPPGSHRDDALAPQQQGCRAAQAHPGLGC